MDDTIADLTQRQQQVISLLPASYEELAESLDIGRSSARDHLQNIREAGVPVGYDVRGKEKVWYYKPEAGEHPANVSPDTSEQRSKAAVTKDVKETVHGLIQYLDEDLSNRPPADPDQGLKVRPSNEDMVVHRSDDHIGAMYTNEFGETTFDVTTAKERLREVSNRAFDLKARQEETGVDFDTMHIVLGGDHIHGVGIYKSQQWETEIPVPEQMRVASDLYMEFIDRAAEEFDSVQVVCQRGNHGELRGDGMGPDDNLDDAVYMMLDSRVRDRDYGNVKFIRSDASYFTNFPIRGSTLNDCEHRAHLRHGQNSLEHIGTSSGKKRWYNWLRQHQFDVSYRGHFHEFSLDTIASVPVIMSGSICPPEDFEESIGEWSEPAATVHGASDDDPVTWMYPIYFE